MHQVTADRPSKPSKPAPSVREVGGSGAETVVEPMAMPNGLLKPEIKEAFTVAPDVVYSPIVSLPALVTNRSEPDTAMPTGPRPKLEINEAFTVVPEVVYSPIVPTVLATNRLSARAAQLDSNPSRTAASHVHGYLQSAYAPLIQDLPQLFSLSNQDTSSFL